MYNKEQIAIERIDWAHQRELVIVATLLGLGLGAIQLVVDSSGAIILVILYIAIVLAFSICFYSIFGFQLEIFKWQKILKENNSVWEIRFEESVFFHFFNFQPEVSIKKGQSIRIDNFSTSSFLTYFHRQRKLFFIN